MARLDCHLEPVDASLAACLVDLWLDAGGIVPDTLVLMTDEWARRLRPYVGEATVMGVALLDIGWAPHARGGQRRRGHFRARPGEVASTLLWPMDAVIADRAGCAFHEVPAPNADHATTRDTRR